MPQEPDSPNTPSRTEVARRWLTALEQCVRTVDYPAARSLFAENVISFGTAATIVQGREALERDQWQAVWPYIRDFTFRLEESHCLGDEPGLCVIVPWDSLGLRPDGSAFSRPGRATFFLTLRGEEWVAVHSHVSLAP